MGSRRLRVFCTCLEFSGATECRTDAAFIETIDNYTGFMDRFWGINRNDICDNRFYVHTVILLKHLFAVNHRVSQYSINWKLVFYQEKRNCEGYQYNMVVNTVVINVINQKVAVKIMPHVPYVLHINGHFSSGQASYMSTICANNPLTGTNSTNFTNLWWNLILICVRMSLYIVVCPSLWVEHFLRLRSEPIAQLVPFNWFCTTETN